jgi:hypothetical protein
MSMDKTIARLGQRHQNKPGGKGRGERTPTPLTRNSNRPERARQSLHFANKSIKDLDDAYREAEHNSYPQKLNKAIYIEALIAVGIRHADEVIALALEQQAKEEEE